MIIQLSLVWGICPVNATFAVHIIVTLGIWNADGWFLTLLGITVPTPYGLVPTVGVTEALHHREMMLYSLMIWWVKESRSLKTLSIKSTKDKASHLRRFESSCLPHVSIIFLLKRRTTNISRGLIFVHNFTLLSELESQNVRNAKTTANV